MDLPFHDPSEREGADSSGKPNQRRQTDRWSDPREVITSQRILPRSFWKSQLPCQRMVSASNRVIRGHPKHLFQQAMAQHPLAQHPLARLSRFHPRPVPCLHRSLGEEELAQSKVQGHLGLSPGWAVHGGMALGGSLALQGAGRERAVGAGIACLLPWLCCW